MKTVVVFGACGFVGRIVVESLRENGFFVMTADRYGVDYPGDIIDEVYVNDLVAQADVVIHLAAQSIKHSIEHPVANALTNIYGSLNIIDAARRHDVEQVVFTSASSLIGKTNDGYVHETHTVDPKTPYGIAKNTIEQYLRVYQDLYGLNYLTFRLFNVYGPGQRPESGGLIPSIYTKLIHGHPIQITGDGSQVRDFIYVGDVADFITWGIAAGVKNTTLNLGTGIGTSINEVIRLSGEITGTTPVIEYTPSRPGEIANFFADTNRLYRTFRKVPDTPLRDGLMNTFVWLEGLTQ